jgi:hypothetical protein
MIVLAVAWVMQRPFISGAVWAISRQELQRLFTDLFTRCHGCLRIERGHFQRLLEHARGYIVWGNIRPLLVARLDFVFNWTSCVNLYVFEINSFIGAVNISHTPHAAYIFYHDAQQYHNIKILIDNVIRCYGKLQIFKMCGNKSKSSLWRHNEQFHFVNACCLSFQNAVERRLSYLIGTEEVRLIKLFG